MPRPRNERQSLERELREELPAQLAVYRQELENGPVISKTRRELLEWQISHPVSEPPPAPART